VLDRIREADFAPQRALRDLAAKQLGTVGAGNHYLDLFAGAADSAQDSAAGLVAGGVFFGTIALAVGLVTWWRGRTAISAYLADGGRPGDEKALFRPPLRSRSIAVIVGGLLMLVLAATFIAVAASDENWPLIGVALSVLTVGVALATVMGGILRLRSRATRQ
jgi:hypothetical protein